MSTHEHALADRHPEAGPNHGASEPHGTLREYLTGFILSVILCWNEYFFAALLTGSVAKTLPVMVASQTGSQGINWWVMAAISTAAIAPLVVIGIMLERYIIKGLTAGAVK